MDAKDRTAQALVWFVGLFIAGTMAVLIVLAFTGQPGGENVWAGLFSLCTAILGAVGGYLGGAAVTERRMNGNGHEPEEKP